MASNYFSWLGLALEIRTLTDVLIEMVEGKKPGQLELFPIDIETRQRFLDLAKTFNACLSNPLDLPADRRSVRHEIFAFVQRLDDAEWFPIIRKMMWLSGGGLISKEDYLQLIKFFDGLERQAIHTHRQNGGL